jgi:hypothetical protein
MSDREPVIIDGITGDVETLPPQKGKRYRCDLNNVNDIKKEMAKLYREARSGLVPTQDATKLTWMLGELRKTIELSDFEQRLEQLEQLQQLKAGK